MFVRSIFDSYSRLLAGLALAFLAIALAGCNEIAAQKAEPGRPVLVATVHYEPESPARSFVGTIRPRIETDMGFRVAAKVAKRLVEVGQTVDLGQPLATLDEVDLKLQAEQADAEFHAATGVLAQAAAAKTRPKALRRADEKLSILPNARRRPPRGRHRDPDRCWTGRGLWTNRNPGGAVRRKGSRGRDPGNAARPCQGRRCHRHPMVGPEQEIRRKTARDRARGRSGNPHLSRKVLAARRRRRGLARHDRDADAVRSRDHTRGAAGVVGAVL